MFTLKACAQAFTEAKNSRFISYLAPYSQQEALLKSLYKEHPKATHIVRAARFFDENLVLHEYANDDNEPKGTSAKPALAALKGARLVNTAALIVRYFGGIKLGPGGLVRAYAAATNAAIEKAKAQELLLSYKPQKLATLSLPHAATSRILHFIDKEGLCIKSKDFKAQGARISLLLDAKELELLEGFLKALNTGDIILKLS